jgi:hypothetical protein
VRPPILMGLGVSWLSWLDPPQEETGRAARAANLGEVTNADHH